MTHNHERIICEVKDCGAVISQCRCIEPKIDVKRGFCKTHTFNQPKTLVDDMGKTMIALTAVIERKNKKIAELEHQIYCLRANKHDAKRDIETPLEIQLASAGATIIQMRFDQRNLELMLQEIGNNLLDLSEVFERHKHFNDIIQVCGYTDEEGDKDIKGQILKDLFNAVEKAIVKK